MSKSTLLPTLFLLFSLTIASRPGTALGGRNPPQQTQQLGMYEVNMDVGEGCEGVGEEECLMRRTLAAHTDYIYTQKENNP
ncbi:hypothetical protein MRB53_017462 [Persea americana]|uniref:Uncharacterized protein n=1 Tax=Persea americana TaxID=3435 RepID=A0ACC2M5N3_PERAE|nr:hypothetical protein MRB53_017462 [Persea americana]